MIRFLQSKKGRLLAASVAWFAAFHMVFLASAVECIFRDFNDFRDKVNKAAFDHAKNAYEEKNGKGTWNDSMLDSNGNGTADPLEGRFYCLGANGYACSEFSAYVHNVLIQPVDKGGLGLPAGKDGVQTVWDNRHSIIRINGDLFCDGKAEVDGFRYVEPQDMQDRRTVYGSLTAFDNPNPARKGIFKPNWAYDGPESSTGYVTNEVSGGGLFGGGGGLMAPMMTALFSALMAQQGQQQQMDPVMQQLYDSFQPEATPTPKPTPTALPKTPTPVATPTVAPTRSTDSGTPVATVAPTPPSQRTPGVSPAPTTAATAASASGYSF